MQGDSILFACTHHCQTIFLINFVDLNVNQIDGARWLIHVSEGNNGTCMGHYYMYEEVRFHFHRLCWLLSDCWHGATVLIYNDMVYITKWMDQGAMTIHIYTWTNSEHWKWLCLDTHMYMYITYKCILLQHMYTCTSNKHTVGFIVWGSVVRQSTFSPGLYCGQSQLPAYQQWIHLPNCLRWPHLMSQHCHLHCKTTTKAEWFLSK